MRVVLRAGEPWFVAADVCKVLSVAHGPSAIQRLDDDEKATVAINHSGPNPNMTIINESGLYSLVLTSRKPEAKRFKRWVTGEVLPSIRKTGSYGISAGPVIPQTLSDALRLADGEKGISTIDTPDGEAWFVAADVCKVLEITNGPNAMSRLDDDEKGIATADTLGGAQKVSIINESGLYSVICAGISDGIELTSDRSGIIGGCLFLMVAILVKEFSRWAP